jgi:hypothetical protein
MPTIGPLPTKEDNVLDKSKYKTDEPEDFQKVLTDSMTMISALKRDESNIRHGPDGIYSALLIMPSLNLCRWSKDWLMYSIVDKCKVMHIGYNNKKEKHEMDGKNMEEVDERKDLGGIMQSNVKWNMQ